MRRLCWLFFAGLLAIPGSALLRSSPRAATPLPESLMPSAETLPTSAGLETLASTDVPAFLRACIQRYRREVRGYTAILEKQEFLDGTLGPVEVVEVTFRDEPHSVLLKWRTDAAGRADRALYVEGAHDGKTLARPKGKAVRFLVGGVVARDSDGPDARAAGRYTLPEFGLRKGTERTLAAWSAAKKRGALHVEYLGIQRIPETGDQDCYVLRRTCDAPEEDGIETVEVAFDTQHWLQVANVLTGSAGRRVAAYYFRDIVLNPEFPPGQFERAALLKE